MSRTLMTLALLTGALTGCNRPPCALNADLTPGCGVVLADGELHLGDTQATVEDRLGAPVVRDLGSLGTRFSWPEQAVWGRYGVPTEQSDEPVVLSLTLDQGFTGSTADGIGIGSDEASVLSAWGEPLRDPFVEGLWYRDRGIALQIADGTVAQIGLFEPEVQ